MFDKFLKKVANLATEAINEVGKNTTNALKEGLSSEISKKTGDVFSSLFDKAKDTMMGSVDYLQQVEKLVAEKIAHELGITSREVVDMSLEEIAAKYGLSVEAYQEKLQQESDKYAANNLSDAAHEVSKRAKEELAMRTKQAAQLQLTMAEFNQLTLQEQADKLHISLDELLVQRALDFKA